MYPALSFLQKKDLVPGPLQVPVRTLLRVLDGADAAYDPVPGTAKGDVSGTEYKDSPLTGTGTPGNTHSGGLEELPADISGYLVMDCMDVGQADCTLIRQGEQAMLFDCGAGFPARICQYLEQEGVTGLDAVWLSHADADHIGALDAVAEKIPVRKIFISPYMEDRDTYAYEKYLRIQQRCGIPVEEVQAGDVRMFGDMQAQVVGPVSRDEEIMNNNCLVLRLVYGDTAFLLCADAQAEEEASIAGSGAVLRSDVLHAAHHGSNTSSTKQFLRAVSPSFAVISCGKENDYGHPGAYALQRLEECGAAVLRTDQNGDIRFLSDGSHIQVSTAFG